MEKLNFAPVMDISALIFQFLNENGQVVVPNFGTFALQKIPASLDEKTKTLLPPAKKIIFSDDFTPQNTQLEKFIAEKGQISLNQAQQQLKNITENWNQKLNSGDTFLLNQFGRLVKVGEQIIFQGQIISENNPDFYGLSSISLTEMKEDKKEISHKNSSKKIRKWWIIFILLMVIAIVTLAIFHPEYIYGKSSF